MAVRITVAIADEVFSGFTVGDYDNVTGRRDLWNRLPTNWQQEIKHLLTENVPAVPEGISKTKWYVRPHYDQEGAGPRERWIKPGEEMLPYRVGGIFLGGPDAILWRLDIVIRALDPKLEDSLQLLPENRRHRTEVAVTSWYPAVNRILKIYRDRENIKDHLEKDVADAENVQELQLDDLKLKQLEAFLDFVENASEMEKEILLYFTHMNK